MTDDAKTEDGTGDGSDTKSLAELQAVQEEQGSKIDQILGILGSKKDDAHDKAQEHTEDRLDRGSSIAEQVRKAVEDVNAQKAQQEAADAHAAEHQALRQASEQKPRESAAGFRGKLQRAMFGKNDG